VIAADVETAQQKLQREADETFELFRKSFDRAITEWEPKHADDRTIVLRFDKDKNPGLVDTIRDRLVKHFTAQGYNSVIWLEYELGWPNYWTVKLTVPLKKV
jgi:hypothetical protein